MLIASRICLFVKAPELLEVSGRFGFNDDMNGMYEMYEEKNCSRVSYHSRASGWWIKWRQNTQEWIICREERKEKSSVLYSQSNGNELNQDGNKKMFFWREHMF